MSCFLVHVFELEGFSYENHPKLKKSYNFYNKSITAYYCLNIIIIIIIFEIISIVIIKFTNRSNRQQGSTVPVLFVFLSSCPVAGLTSTSIKNFSILIILLCSVIDRLILHIYRGQNLLADALVIHLDSMPVYLSHGCNLSSKSTTRQADNIS